MPWETDAAGQVIVHENQLLGWYKANEPAGNAADHVQVVGVAFVGHREALQPVLLVQCAEFGAVPTEAGWTTPTEQFDPEEFYESHTEITPAERAALALEQTAKGKAADEAHLKSEVERAARWQAQVSRRAAQLKKTGGDLT